MDLLRPASSPPPSRSKDRGNFEDYQFKEQAQGLSIGEQQQIARMFRGLNVGPESALTYFLLLRIAAVAGSAALGYGLLLASKWPLPLLGPTIAAMTAWFVPLIPIRMAAEKHRKAVGAGLPDALDLLAICADAGISLESGLQRLAQELRDAQPALAGELLITWAQISILTNRDQALMNLADRIGLPSLRSVTGTLSQSMRFGTPLAQSLRTAAAELRNDRLLRMEERANRLPAMMTFPVMLLIMPTIFLIVGGPAVIKILNIFGTSGASP
jgi:tight adherence protein C